MNNQLAPRPEAILAQLDGVQDPVTGKGLMAAGRISGLAIDDHGAVRFVLEAPAERLNAYQDTYKQAQAAVGAVKGVAKVTAVLTAHEGPTATRVSKGAPPPPTKSPTQSVARVAEGIPHVREILAVASAKGGVGKSTIAANLACALAAQGLKVGLLDLDIYGPSIPTLFGLTEEEPNTDDRNQLIPLQAFGLKIMSIGFVVDTDAPLIWRGPMATKAVRQMLDDVAWASARDPLDVLVLDFPPGTGDIQLTIAQRLPLSGAVIVSTPQEVALADVRRGIVMFDSTAVPILGIIENMAWLEQPDGGKLHLFGEGGARRTAEAFGAPFLGELPIDVRLRESADAGRPLVATDTAHPMSRRFDEIARQTMANMRAATKPPPAILIE